MGVMDKDVWQWSIRRPGTVEWRMLGRCITETEARHWAVQNGYEIRRGERVQPPTSEPAHTPPSSRERAPEVASQRLLNTSQTRETATPC